MLETPAAAVSPAAGQGAAAAEVAVKADSDSAVLSSPVATKGEEAKQKPAKGKKAAKPGKDSKAAKKIKPAASTSSSSQSPSAVTSPRPAVNKPGTPSLTSPAPLLAVSVDTPSASTQPTSRQPVTSALSSPSKARTVEETLGFWSVPMASATRPLSPLLTLCADNRYAAVMDHMRSLPLHLRQAECCRYDAHGNTALFYCLQPSHSALLSLLLEYGSDVNHVNDKRNTALHLAVWLQQRRAMQTLIEAGANMKVENWEHQQPHAILRSSEKAQQAQNFLNSCYDAHQQRLAEGTVAQPVQPEVRGYFRGVFDVMDAAGLGCLTFPQVEGMLRARLQEREEKRERDNPRPVVRNTIAEREKERERQAKEREAGLNAAAPVDYVLQWFGAMDADHNGVISFSEFLAAVMSWKAEQDKEEKKTKGKGKKKKAQ